ncbi:hypothetical protein ABPG74_005770 [Tetrahymena malaccensis]
MLNQEEFKLFGNGCPHNSEASSEFFKERKVKIINQAPYSPDMNFCDRFLFRNFEIKRSKTTFKNIDEILEFLLDFLQELSLEILRNQYKYYINYLQETIKNNGIQFSS